MKTQINDELKHKKAFTLVELIIVITILVILATIAFVSFQNYTKDSRDANRLTTINNISKGLDVFQIKTGFYPEPESKTSFTGAGDKKLHQGIISDNITNTINLSEIPLDPKEKTNYIYSTYGDGKYYQIASEAENITSFLYNTTYAENKSSIVRGNYKFDPSLPSLIVITNSLTGSSIFDPKVCFVTNGGVNSITSNSGTCLKKEEMSLKNFDSGLVGYWDMETIFNSGGTDYLKDLSGNNNDLIGTGGMVLNGSNIFQEGVFGKSINFLGTGGKLFTPNILAYKNQTIIAIGKNNFYDDIRDNQFIFHVGSGDGLGGLSEINLGLSNINTFNRRIVGYFGSAHFNSNQILLTKRYYTINDWNIYVLKWNELGNISLFVNGQKISEQKIKDISTSYFSGGTSIGGPYFLGPFPSVFNRYWNGLIDEVKIYNRALSDQEIAQQARIAGF